jgi:hypothetical protein
VLVLALLRISFMRARQGINLPFPSKIGALTMMNESPVDFRHFSLDRLVCAEMAHGLVSARVSSGPAIATSAAEEVLK